MGNPDILLGISPLAQPDVKLIRAVCRAGASGVLDLGCQKTSPENLSAVAQEIGCPFGVLLCEENGLDPATLPPQVDLVVLTPATDLKPWRSRRVLVQVTSSSEARDAVRAGAQGLIAKGCESGGRVGEESAFVLLQRLRREFDVPIWVQGGIGLHTAAAAIAGGAAGVVLDTQLALARESSLPEAMKKMIGKLDGSETTIVSGQRGLRRRKSTGPPDPFEPAQDFLPIGQDAPFAPSLATRFPTAEEILRAIKQSIRGHLTQARSANPLAPGSPLALAHGIRYPIVQGPMTRVSDRPAFAEAVSRAGGLPFLALSLLRGEPLRTLLAETAALLEGRAWGVGILGFVPPEIRDEQLAAILDVRPPVALIAGGRPSQARSAEAAGISTYLHVPSPVLLDLFLKDGARHFVFEGSECGGHIGPRTSFALWETQMERLLAFGEPEQLSVLFAGGIHDARSAAMVAAMAAPLAARGARIGVLVGSAYLFTREAVECGAIGRAFQQAALDCTSTALLETGPGHAIRCAETGYTRAFAEEKRRLEQQGSSPRATWEALEQLNLGRLRLAAKGLRRDHDDLVAVDEETQRREGMFMIGQISALRSEIGTTAELHRDISEGSSEYLASAQISAAPQYDPPPIDVAIVGMACLFPGAPDLETYWSNIVRGVNSVTEVPRERWNPDLYYDPHGPPGEKTPSKWGAFLPEIAFDPLRYGIPPRSLSAIDPVQLLSLEVARRALEDAGYGERDFPRDRTSVIFGAEASGDLAGAYGFRALFPQYAGPLPPALGQHLPSLTEDSFPGVLANVIAGRIANRLDLGGANYTVDAACASSLAAVDVASKELVTGGSDMVLCGGADLHNSIADYLLFSSAHALSPSGQCRTFDAEADGIVLGEGVGVLVLKRLRDAERDGDRIYAVIKGVGSSSDGRSMGLTAPRKDGQVRALARAYRNARLSPGEIGLIEAHGTGTVVGDATELASLHETFGRAGAQHRSCVLGSVKSQIGHTKCAAGLAGLIKAALALHHRVLPPTVNIGRPNASYEPASSPFVFLDAARPWPREKRNAGVSSFGFGGTNFHVVLSAAPGQTPPPSGMPEWPEELFLFRGTDRAAALRTVEQVEGRLDSGEPFRLRDLAFSTAAAGEGPVQLAMVAGRDDLKAKLSAVRLGAGNTVGTFFASGPAGLVAFLFPGQGSQRVGMLADLFVAFPGLGSLFVPGSRWRNAMFPPPAFDLRERAEQNASLTDTRVAQPALGIAGLAIADLLGSCGVRPDVVGGHSYGELVALCVSGSISRDDLLKLSEARGECILQAAGKDPGAMAAVRATAAELARALETFTGVVVANQNAPDQFVISGPTSDVRAALDRLRELGISAHPLPVACAFHSPVVARAGDLFLENLRATDIASPRLPVWSNTTASPYPSEPEAIRRQLAEHLALPVRFAEEVEAMYAAGVRVFVEAGPGRVLASLVKRILGGRPHAAIACDDEGQRGLRSFLLALAELATKGLPVDPSALFLDRGAKRVDLVGKVGDSRPREDWLVNGHRARPRQGLLPDFALKPTLEPCGFGAGESRDASLVEFLRNMRELADQQTSVMVRYLGGMPNEEAKPPSRQQLPVVEVPQVRELPSSPLRSVAEELRAIISDRTGYPVEMLDLDLDMEADLSIDSIKRVEMFGLLSERLGLRGRADLDQDKLTEQLAGMKTLRDVTEWLERLPGLSREGGAAEPASPPMPAGEPALEIASPVARFVLSLERTPAPQVNGKAVAGCSFQLIPDDRGVAERLAAALQGRGAATQIIPAGAPMGKSDGVIHLASLRAHPAAESVHALFHSAQQALSAGTARLLAATALAPTLQNGNGVLVGGEAGFLKSLARERPDMRFRVVDIDWPEDSDFVTSTLLQEFLSDDPPLEVAYRGGIRHVVRAAHQPFQDTAPSGGLQLGPDSVVLLTGGARGITARITIELSKRFRCRLELVGRTPLPPAADDDEIAAARDLPSLRSLLASRDPCRKPAEIEAALRRIVAVREIRETLEAVRRAGGSARYQSLDVRDAAAFGALIDDLYSRHGRLDGVVHGAGVIEDKLLGQKTPDSFRRVFETKVHAALTLAEKLRSDVGFTVFFSSVSGLFGNRGQTDYSAASEALDRIAVFLKKRLAGRVVSIDWGPWDGVGMVSPELKREYLRRGIELISPEEGVDALFSELDRGDPADLRVVWMKGGGEVLR